MLTTIILKIQTNDYAANSFHFYFLILLNTRKLLWGEGEKFISNHFQRTQSFKKIKFPVLSYDMLKSLKNCTQQMLIIIGLKLWSSEGSLSVTWAFIRDANFQMGGDSKICVFISTADGSVALNAKGRKL